MFIFDDYSYFDMFEKIHFIYTSEVIDFEHMMLVSPTRVGARGYS